MLEIVRLLRRRSRSGFDFVRAHQQEKQLLIGYALGHIKITCNTDNFMKQIRSARSLSKRSTQKKNAIVCLHQHRTHQKTGEPAARTVFKKKSCKNARVSAPLSVEDDQGCVLRRRAVCRAAHACLSCGSASAPEPAFRMNGGSVPTSFGGTGVICSSIQHPAKSPPAGCRASSHL